MLKAEELDKANPTELIYEGSVKRVWQAPKSSDHLYFEFTDDYSVFDWGKMPDTIANKGRALTIMGAFFFKVLADPKLWQSLPNSEHLEKFDQKWLNERWKHPFYRDDKNGLATKGATSHFVGLSAADSRIDNFAVAAKSSPLYMEVLKAAVAHPEEKQLLGQTLYFYPNTNSNIKMVPLELVFRFGMPNGSSLKDRLAKDPSYAQTLGLNYVPKEEGWFPHPVIEFFTKLESKDRLLNWTEAVLLSGLNATQFENMIELLFDTALALHVIFADKGMELWDGKIELAISLDPKSNQWDAGS